MEKDDISELIEDSDAENTKRQRKYAVSRRYLRNYDIDCLINSSAKSNSLFWYYKTNNARNNECFYSCNGKNIFIR